MATPFQLGREKNSITIADDFKVQELRKVLAAIHDAVNIKKYTDLVLDFSRCTSAFASAMLPICTHVMLLRLSRIDFDLKLPTDC